MQVNVAGFRRNIKNLAHNYSDAQIKVREATSNDPWGPSATIMAEVADLTYNVVAFSEIMQMIWKRLNDHGKNWRHVYKALILLEYLIKTGTEKVAQQCKENIFAIQTLKEFQHQEECNDQGIRVREKAKQLVALLKDDERLKNERTKALKAKERFAQNASGFGSDGSIDGPTHHRDSPSSSSAAQWRSETDGAMRTGGSGGSGGGGGGAGAAPLEIEYVRPQTVGEEELQLQLAMAMSREEAEQEEAKRRSDDVRLQLALSQSENDFKQETAPPKQESHLLDLLDISLGATSISSPPLADAWGMSKPPAVVDPWASGSAAALDPWQSGAGAVGGGGGMGAARPTPSAAAIGGGAGAASVESWLSRTQSSSSGSSAESAWLQNGGVMPPATNGGYPMQQQQAAASVGGDPWLSGKPQPIDQWLSKGAAAAPADPWQSPNLGHTNGHGASNGSAAAASAAAANGAQVIDPWAGPSPTIGARPSPIGAQMSPNSDLDDFDVITNRSKSASGAANNNNSSFLDDLDPLSTKNATHSPAPQIAAPVLNNSRTPQSFLGENSGLVNLDNLIKPAIPGGQPAFGGGGALSAAYSNPFGETGTQPKTNLFQQQSQPMPSINQLKASPFPVTLNQDPWAPIASNQAANTNQFDDTNGNDHCHMVIDDTDDDGDGNQEAADDEGNDIFYYTNFNEYDQADNLRFLNATGNLNFTNNLTQPQHVNNMSMNNNNNNMNNPNPNMNAPWLRPEAAASNPFLS